MYSQLFTAPWPGTALRLRVILAKDTPHPLGSLCPVSGQCGGWGEENTTPLGSIQGNSEGPPALELPVGSGDSPTVTVSQFRLFLCPTLHSSASTDADSEATPPPHLLHTNLSVCFLGNLNINTGLADKELLKDNR